MVVLFNYIPDFLFDVTFITKHPELLKKFDEGYSEVCLQDYYFGKKHRACLLDNSWYYVSSDRPDFYMEFNTTNACTYRKFVEPYDEMGLFFDQKIHAKEFNLPECNSGIEYNLKWEKSNWKLTKVKEGYFFHHQKTD